MRIARVAHPEGVAFVVVEGDGDGATAREVADHPFGEPTFTGRRWPFADVRALAPILPSKVVCVGKNYGGPLADPVIFLKPSTAVVGPEAAIRLPADSSNVVFEGELAAVIGRPCRDVPAAQAKSVLLGYTIANDVTARDHVAADSERTRGKSHDTFCPLGPWIDTAVSPDDLVLRTELDGVVKQDARTSGMLHDVPTLVEWITRVMTLLPGDVILTGTPAGVDRLAAGQTVAVTIEGIGTLRNPVEQR